MVSTSWLQGNMKRGTGGGGAVSIAKGSSALPEGAQLRHGCTGLQELEQCLSLVSTLKSHSSFLRVYLQLCREAAALFLKTYSFMMPRCSASLLIIVSNSKHQVLSGALQSQNSFYSRVFIWASGYSMGDCKTRTSSSVQRQGKFHHKTRNHLDSWNGGKHLTREPQEPLQAGVQQD